ncbi:MAG TPA: AraC family transcriptional regulator [Clostridiales bacterium]|nr:AraC family transcriptional regulator [Clostridiales bacterium]
MAEQHVIDISILNQHFQDINPLTCGWEDCIPGHSYGPAAREYYLIHFILSGKGFLERGGVRDDLGPGSLFLIRPEELTFYQADHQEPWRYVWIGFTGNRIAGLLEKSPLSKGRSTVFAPYLSGIFEKIRAEVEDQQAPELFLCARIFELFALLQRETVTQPGSDAYVLRAADYMKANYARPISIGGIARLIGIDRRYFGRIFARSTGQTPKQYLINLRLDRAAFYLVSRGYTVGEAARSVGYDDVFNFSKMFKRRFGIAPQFYKKSSVRS